MKVGLSYSRCVRDIVDGVIDIDDVLVVISRTDFDPNVDEQWASIWRGYHWSNPEWADYGDETEEQFRDVSRTLFNTGKLHQPRKFGAHPIRRPEIWLETVLVEGDLDSNPMAKKAFEKFQTVAGLSSITLDESYK